MSAEKRSISAPDTLFAKADLRKEELGYSTFSDYIQALMRADTLGGGDHLREADNPRPKPPVESPISYKKPLKPIPPRDPEEVLAKLVPKRRKAANE